MSTPPRFLEGTAPKKYEGVEGWLVVFCLLLIFFVPVSTLYQVFGNVLPLISRTHDSRREILWTVYIVFFLGIAGFGLVTGIRLWLVRPGVVRLAKLWLLAFFCAHVCYFFLWLALFQGHGSEPVAKIAWGHVVRPLVPFLVWTAYLEYSKRVRQTYTN